MLMSKPSSLQLGTHWPKRCGQIFEKDRVPHNGRGNMKYSGSALNELQPQQLLDCCNISDHVANIIYDGKVRYLNFDMLHSSQNIVIRPSRKRGLYNSADKKKTLLSVVVCL